MAVLEPRITISTLPAQQTVGLLEQRALIIGQMLDTGTAVAGELIQDHPNDGSENTLFGRRSHLSSMVREFKRINGATALDIIPLSDSTSGIQAVSYVTFSGTATATGTFYVTVGSEFSYTYKLDVSVGDTADDLGDLVETAFTGYADAPFTAFNTSGAVTFTAANAGTMANNWCIKVSGSAAGITVALTGWQNGGHDPDLTDVLDVIDNIRYRTVVWPDVYSLTTIDTLLEERFNQEYKIMDGVAIQVKGGTLASLKAYATQNSPSIVLIGLKAVDATYRKGFAIMEIPDVIAAQIAAYRALRYEDDKLLSRFHVTTSNKDQYGGMHIASLPYFNVKMPYLTVPNRQDDFSVAEQKELTDNGISVIGANRSNSDVILGQIVTTYLTNAAGDSDDSFHYLEVVDTQSNNREYFYENIRNAYAQTRLTDGALKAGYDMANEESIRAFCGSLYSNLALLALVQAGPVAKKDFDDNLSVEVSVREGQVVIAMAPLLVTQLRSVLGTIRVNFGSN